MQYETKTNRPNDKAQNFLENVVLYKAPTFNKKQSTQKSLERSQRQRQKQRYFGGMERQKIEKCRQTQPTPLPQRWATLYSSENKNGTRTQIKRNTIQDNKQQFLQTNEPNE